MLDALVYKDHNNMLQTTIYRKQTDRQNYFDTQSEHLKLLKNSISYKQDLRIKRICSSQQEFRYYATFKVRKFESLSYKINTCLQKTITCIGLQAEEIFSVNI